MGMERSGQPLAPGKMPYRSARPQLIGRNRLPRTTLANHARRSATRQAQCDWRAFMKEGVVARQPGINRSSPTGWMRLTLGSPTAVLDAIGYIATIYCMRTAMAAATMRRPTSPIAGNMLCDRRKDRLRTTAMVRYGIRTRPCIRCSNRFGSGLANLALPGSNSTTGRSALPSPRRIGIHWDRYALVNHLKPFWSTSNVPTPTSPASLGVLEATLGRAVLDRARPKIS